MAEGLVEAGGTVHCLDQAPAPPKTWEDAKLRLRDRSDGALRYHQVDVTQNDALEECVAGIAAEKERLDGLIAGKFFSDMDLPNIAHEVMTKVDMSFC